MGRYYFDLENGDGETLDNEGMELPSRERVSQEASRIVAEIARDEIPEMREGTIALTIRDSEKKIVGKTTLTFATRWVANGEKESSGECR
jgi:hypothetical protein